MLSGYNLVYLWQNMFWPLVKLLSGMCLGLFLAAMLEYMGWTNFLAKIFEPFVKFGHLGKSAAAAFSLAFVSPYAANGLLSEAWHDGKICKSELILAQICNSFPASLVHLPTLFFISWPVLGHYTLALVGINLASGMGRTFLALLAGHFIFAKSVILENSLDAVIAHSSTKMSFQNAIGKAYRRFRRRVYKLVAYTAPFYFLIWICREKGFFEVAQKWLLQNMPMPDFLGPETLSLVILQMFAETGASLGAAGAILENSSISGKEVVIALLAGNILATPIRALRHQLPSMAGFYRPGLAITLVLITQVVRAVSLLFALLIYF